MKNNIVSRPIYSSMRFFCKILGELFVRIYMCKERNERKLEKSEDYLPRIPPSN